MDYTVSNSMPSLSMLNLNANFTMLIIIVIRTIFVILPNNTCHTAQQYKSTVIMFL